MTRSTEANKKHRQANKLYLDNYKRAEGCAMCGKKTKLTFHHVNREEKDFNIATKTSMSLERLKEEIAKCVVLCKSCHEEVHANDVPIVKKPKKKVVKKKAVKKVKKSRVSAKRPRVAKTRNNNTMTESAYWGMIRSGLRRTCRYWRPAMEARNKARRKYVGPNKRQKWEYQCAKCKQWYMSKNTAVDHITPVGSLKCAEDLPGFIKRLTPEKGFQLLCHSCHQEKTNKERKENGRNIN